MITKTRPPIILHGAHRMMHKVTNINEHILTTRVYEIVVTLRRPFHATQLHRQMYLLFPCRPFSNTARLTKQNAYKLESQSPPEYRIIYTYFLFPFLDFDDPPALE